MYLNRFSYNIRIGGAFAICTVIMIVLPLIANYAGSPSLGFTLCMITLLVFGLLAGLI